MKNATQYRTPYAALSRKVALGLASGLLFAGVLQPPSTALAHPDRATTGSYSDTGDVSGGAYTVDQGLAVTTESAGGAAVNPDKASVSVTGSTLTVKSMLSASGYGGYSYRDAIAAAMAAQNNLALSGTVMVTADDDNLYGAFGGYAYAGQATVPTGTSGTVSAAASGNTIVGTGADATFHFITDFSKVTIPEVDEYSPGTISPEAGMELRSALMGGYAETFAASQAGAEENRNAQSLRASAVADDNTVSFSTLTLLPEVNVTGQDSSQGQAVEYRSMVTAGGGQAVAVSNARGAYVDHSDSNIASSDGNIFTVGTLNLEERVSSVRAELEQTTTLSGGDALARYQSPSFRQKLSKDAPKDAGKVSVITETYQNTTYNNIINTATADNNTETIDAIVIGGKLNTDDQQKQATDIEAEGELETRAGHAEAIVFLNDTDSKLDGLVNNAQANGNTLTVKKVEQNIEQTSKKDEQGTIVQASTVTMLLHGGNARNEITQNGTDNVTWTNVKSSAAADHNTITLEAISSNVTESSLTAGAATSDILPMEGTGTMKATIASNTASSTGNTAQMGLTTPVNMGLGCVVSGGVADVSVASQNNFNNNEGTDNGLTMDVVTMSADASSNTIKVAGKIDSSGNNNSAATTITANGGSATAGLSFVGATTTKYLSKDAASWQNGAITANGNTVDLTTTYTYTAPTDKSLKAALPTFSAMGGNASGSLGSNNVNATVTLGNLGIASTGNKITINNLIDITGAPKGSLDTSYTLTGGAASFGISDAALVLKDTAGKALTVTPQPFIVETASPAITASSNTIDVTESIKGTAGAGSASSSSTTVDTIEGGNASFTFLDDTSTNSTASLSPTLTATGNAATIASTDTSNGGVASIEGSNYSGGTAASAVTSGKAPAAGDTAAAYTKNNAITYAPTMTVSGNTLTLSSSFDASTDTTTGETATGVISGGKANLDFTNYGNNTTLDVTPKADVTGNTALVTLNSATTSANFTGLARTYGGAVEMSLANGSAAASSKDSSGQETTTPASEPTGLSFTASPVLNASGNTLTIQDTASDGTKASAATGITGLYGGRSAVNVNDLGKDTKAITLSSASLTADQNIVTTNRSTVDVYGGQAAIETNAAISASNLTMSASGNEVTIDGDCAKNVYGGSVLLSDKITPEGTTTLSADNNVVNYNAGNVLGVLYGGLIESGGTQSCGTGNTLNVNGGGFTAANIAGFDTVNFHASVKDIKASPLLKLTDGKPTDLSGAKISATLHTDSVFAVGDVAQLLANEATIKTDAGTNFGNGTLTQGAVTEYKGVTALSADGKSIDFTAESRSLNEQSKSVAETRAATTTLLNSGADFLASAGITNAINAAAIEAFGGISSTGSTSAIAGSASETGRAAGDSDGNTENSGSVGEAKAARGGNFAPFAALGGSSLRAKSGSYVDTRGWGINVGFARALKNKSGVMTFGPIVEYGRGNYSSHLDDGTLGFGDTQFFGVGVFLRQNNTDGLWYEGSLRAGRMKSDYRGNLNNQNVTYDTSSNYFAAHLGVGKVNKVSEKGSLDLYTKLFYAHQAGSDADLSTGEHFDFGSVNSLRWRVGGKYSHRVSKTGSVYAGLAYEYEFKGDATASYQGMSTPSPSVKGGSGLLELGYTIKSDVNSPVTLDFGLNLWTGKKEGVGGTFSVSWAL